MSEALRLAHELILAMRDTDAEHWDTLEEAAAELRRLHAALAEPEQEPVGHADLGINNIYIFSESEPRVVPAGRTPLYTAPPPRKPLSEDEIVRLMVGEDRVQLLYAKPGDPYFSEFAEGAIRELVESGRAIEKAHGIGAQHGS